MATDNDAPPTLYQFQHAFLDEQIRLLSLTALRPSSAWRAANDDAAAAADDDGSLSADAVAHALARANDAARRHYRRVYTPQATRVVAERLEDRQLDALDQDGGDGGGGGVLAGDGVDGGPPGVDVDFTDDSAVAALATTWPSARDRTALPDDAARYADLVQQLSDMSRRRSEMRARVERLRRVGEALRPFGAPPALRDGDFEEQQQQQQQQQQQNLGVQENLVTRGCELERELERMKVLLARVGGRVALLPAKENDAVEDTIITAGDASLLRHPASTRHLEAVLDGL